MAWSLSTVLEFFIDIAVQKIKYFTWNTEIKVFFLLLLLKTIVAGYRRKWDFSRRLIKWCRCFGFIDNLFAIEYYKIFHISLLLAFFFFFFPSWRICSTADSSCVFCASSILQIMPLWFHLLELWRQHDCWCFFLFVLCFDRLKTARFAFTTTHWRLWSERGSCWLRQEYRISGRMISCVRWSRRTRTWTRWWVVN